MAESIGCEIPARFASSRWVRLIRRRAARTSALAFIYGKAYQRPASSAEPRAYLREQVEIGLDHARPGVRAGDELGARGPEAITERRVVDEEPANIRELRRRAVGEPRPRPARHASEHRRPRAHDHGPSRRPGLEGHERERLQQARHHER